MSWPEGFRFGVATAAFQIEGATSADGRGESIWDVFCRRPGAVVGGETGDVACDHYHRWEADLDLMASLGVESYRFSVAWPRILPSGRGPVNPRGLDFYRRLTTGMLERGIEPIATLYHWDLPQRLQDAGGWEARDTALRFAEYAAVVAEALGDQVTQWITQNEPWCTSLLGYQVGRKAPGITDWRAGVAASHHVLLAHGLAVPAIRAVAPGAEVGIALNLAPVHPATDTPADRAAAARQDGYLNRWFLDPVLTGAYPEDMCALYERHAGPLDVVQDGDLATIAVPIDFLGVNYYNPMRVRASDADPVLGLEHVEPTGWTTAMGWEVDADGLVQVLRRLRTEYAVPPIQITENGAAFDDVVIAGVVDDAERTEYLMRHLDALQSAIGEGSDVRRYCVWSFLDNFEWEDGYDKRFGIVHVDYATQQRTVKRSGLWYRDLIARSRNGDGRNEWPASASQA